MFTEIHTALKYENLHFKTEAQPFLKAGLLNFIAGIQYLANKNPVYFNNVILTDFWKLPYLSE